MAWIVLAVIVLFGVFLVGMYNSLVQLSVRSESAWSDIDVQLKRRHDLIPNLVETVKGYAAHERGTLEAVIQARAAAVSTRGAGPAESARAEGELSGALRQLYPGAASGLRHDRRGARSKAVGRPAATTRHCPSPVEECPYHCA